MDIRSEENKLFEEWSEIYPNTTFVEDGCVSPVSYLKEKVKVVFLLKDENTGACDQRVRPLRDEFISNPHKWWRRIARWMYLISNPTSSWNKAVEVIENKDGCVKYLSLCCIVNLKKVSGFGSVSDETIAAFVDKDKFRIIRQLSLYSPNILVACGNGDEAIKLFGDSSPEYVLNNGVRYWEVILNGNKSYLVDYCHPSVRSGNKIKGLIATELAKSIDEIIKLKLCQIDEI